MKKILFLAFMLLSVAAIAQPDDPGDNPDIQPVPVDGGVVTLAIAGAAYGIKKFKEARKTDNANI